MARQGAMLVLEADRPVSVLSLVLEDVVVDRRFLLAPASRLHRYVAQVVAAAEILGRRARARPARCVIVQECAGGDSDSMRPDAVIRRVDLPWLQRALADELRLPLALVGAVDRSVAVAMAHGVYGIGKELGDHAHVGLGCDAGAIVVDGCLWGLTVAHLVIDPAGPPCQCGKRGCLAAFTDVVALAREERLMGLDGLRPTAGPRDQGLAEHLGERALRDRCPLAIEILSSAGAAIGIAVAGLLNTADIRDVVVHATTRAWQAALPAVWQSVEQHTFAATRDGLRFHRVDSSFEAASLGAGAIPLTSRALFSASPDRHPN